LLNDPEYCEVIVFKNKFILRLSSVFSIKKSRTHSLHIRDDKNRGGLIFTREPDSLKAEVYFLPTLTFQFEQAPRLYFARE